MFPSITYISPEPGFLRALKCILCAFVLSLIPTWRVEAPPVPAPPPPAEGEGAGAGQQAPLGALGGAGGIPQPPAPPPVVGNGH
jgi:hypothetical protein